MKCNYDLIDNLLTNYDYLDGMVNLNYDTLKGVDYKPTKIETNENSDITADKAMQVIEKKEEMEKIIIILRKIKMSLDYLKSHERKIIKKYYFQKKEWLIVSSELGYSMRQCQRIRKKAIRKIFKFCFLDPNEYKNIKKICSNIV